MSSHTFEYSFGGLSCKMMSRNSGMEASLLRVPLAWNDTGYACRYTNRNYANRNWHTHYVHGVHLKKENLGIQAYRCRE